jgi:hypothetical protein
MGSLVAKARSYQKREAGEPDLRTTSRFLGCECCGNSSYRRRETRMCSDVAFLAKILSPFSRPSTSGRGIDVRVRRPSFTKHWAK